MERITLVKLADGEKLHRYLMQTFGLPVGAVLAMEVYCKVNELPVCKATVYAQEIPEEVFDLDEMVAEANTRLRADIDERTSEARAIISCDFDLIKKNLDYVCESAQHAKYHTIYSLGRVCSHIRCSDPYYSFRWNAHHSLQDTHKGISE